MYHSKFSTSFQTITFQHSYAPYHIMRNHPATCGTILHYLRPSQAILQHAAEYGTTLRHSIWPRTIMHHFAPSDTIYAIEHHLARFWTITNQTASLWTNWYYPNHPAPFATMIHYRAQSFIICHHPAPSGTTLHHLSSRSIWTIVHHSAPSDTTLHHLLSPSTILHHPTSCHHL